MSGSARTSIPAVAVGVGLTVALLVALIAFAPRGKSSEPPIRTGLHAIMTTGPAAGLWRLETIDSVHIWAVEEVPGDDTCLYVAREDASGELGPARRWPRDRAAAFFAPGDEDLFFANYRLLDEPVTDGGLVAAVWIPLHDSGGDTARHVWMDAASGDVVRLEDRSFLGYCIRCLERQMGAPLLDPAAGGDNRGGCDAPTEEPPSIARVAAETPFPLLAPTYLPPGFELVQSGFYSWPIKLASAEDEEEEITRHIRMAYLTYSDGLARIALGVAASDDMNAFEESQSRIPHNPDACPALPKSGSSFQTGGVRIRRRYDRCRTVLRLDALPGVSVSLIARNELPPDEYVDVIASVQPVEGGAKREEEAGPSAHDDE